MENPSTLAIYIHWPFCLKKCPYCDFNSHVREQVDHALWRESLLAELRHWRAQTGPRHVGSIFFGGGTPSLMQPQTVEALLREVEKIYGFDADCEITLEANPTSVEAGKFRDLAAAGVNRVSLGVQSLKPESLKFLGREHSADEALKAVGLAARIFPRHSFDLIYALPDHTPDIWEAELRQALTHANGHLSLYQLTIEENTAFHHAYHNQHAFDLPAEPVAAELYLRTQQVMEAAGLPAYEISNHAAAGQESRHNLTYWRGQPYLGIGPGAHGRVNGSATRNLKSPERWLESVSQRQHGLEEQTALTPEERMEEKILMGLRLTQEGIDPARFTAEEKAAFGQRTNDGRIMRLIELGLLAQSDTQMRATPDGQLVLNSLITELLK
jgi:oxygen-independent coproporphyrinogen-3 oxidase